VTNQKQKFHASGGALLAALPSLQTGNAKEVIERSARQNDHDN
jgi:hypothetical protein